MIFPRSLRAPILLALIASPLFSQQAADEPSQKETSFELPGSTRLLFKEVGDVQLHLHVFKPEGWHENDRRAAIVFFFGGGWVGGTPAQFEPQAKHLASRGMVALAAEYRVRSRHGVHPVECVVDAKDAVRWAREHARELGIDSARLVVAGGSAGGHLAASTATLGLLPEETPSPVSCRPNALVLYNPVCDTTMLGYGGERLGTRAYELSPVHHIRKRMPPTLLFHGQADKTVPFENAVRFQQLMHDAGNACELVPYPEAGHGFFNPGRERSEYEDTTRRLDDFLTKIGFLPPADADAKTAGQDLHQWAADLDADATTRRRAAQTIGLFGEPADALLIEMLSNDDAAVRYHAASSIGDRRAPEAALEDLRTVLKQDPVRGVRLAAAYAICRLGDTQTGLPVLQEMLATKERGTACSAAEFLGRVGPPAAALVTLLRDAQEQHNRNGDYHVRGAIKNAIRKITQDTELENHQRPTGGRAPRGWQPSEISGPGGSALARRPNILWISCEDISPNLGCYGDRYASTPNLDTLARQGARFDRAFTPAGVCAVVRSGIITGIYPISLGSQHMRSNIVPPTDVKCFSEYLRAAGYFCTNKSKTDYQFSPPKSAWDRQGNGHNDWRDRGADQPFFSVINLTCSHESQIRHGERTHAAVLAKLAPGQAHDPDLAERFLPPIYADTLEARKDWAWYADNISDMDRQVGLILRQLEEDGLAENTIVVFWGDHGRGLPRGKRWIYESGVHIPLIVRWPGHVQPDTVREDLVSTQDLAPTMLAMAGLEPQPYMQGRVFLGGRTQAEPEFLFFHRDRMDEAYELMRGGGGDRRYKYIRNYQTGKTYAQHIDYMDRMPTLVDLRRRHTEGRLTPAQARFFRQVKPVEELYDLDSDPHETVNLAWLPEQASRVARMRSALERWQTEIVDVGMVPEPVLMEQMRPGDELQRTATPNVDWKDGKLSIDCETEGASLVYRVGGAGEWKLYTQPIKLDASGTIDASACRLGYRDSDVTQLVVSP